MAPARRPWLPWGVGLALLAAALGGFLWYRAEEEAREGRARADRREARETERTERQAASLARLREESAALIPGALGELALGMKLSDVRAARPQLRRRMAPGDPTLGLTHHEERLPNGSEVVYGFDREEYLSQIQIMSVLPSAEALEAHLTAMIETYGSPTGVWDCPDTGGVPTRRFTWRRAETALADILLVYGNRISQTLYIAPEEVIGMSLQRSRCRPVESREDLAIFPTTTLEQIQKTQALERAQKRPPGSPPGGR